MIPAYGNLLTNRFAVFGRLPADVREATRGFIVPLRDIHGQIIGHTSLFPDGSTNDYKGTDPRHGAHRLEQYPGGSAESILLAYGLQEGLALWYLTEGKASVWCGWQDFPDVVAMPRFVRRVTVAAAPAEETDRLGYDPAECIAGELVAVGLNVGWLPLLSASFDAEVDARWPRRGKWWLK